MKKGSLIYIIIIALGILFLFMFESSLPPKVDWTERYLPEGTNPFDLKVVNDQLASAPQFERIEKIEQPFYVYSNEHESEWTEGGYLFLYIGPFLEMDSITAAKLHAFVAAGNDVFISANYVDEAVFDKFKKYTESDYLIEKSENWISLCNNQAIVNLRKSSAISTIYNEDTTPYKVLGEARYNTLSRSYPNFIEIPYQKGKMYLHTAPIVFTNYYLLYGEAANYVSYALSYTDKHKLLIYSKPSADLNREKIGASSLRFIFEHVQLRYAWYLALIALLTFIVFNAKRRQRKIPIVKPLENTTVRFAKTIANLFYETKNHHYIINKRIIYFLEHIRNQYHLDTQQMNEDFVQVLSAKSGVSMEACTQLVQWIQRQQNVTDNTAVELVHLNQMLETFKKQERTL